MKLPEYDILNKCLKIQMDLNANGKTNWYQNVANIIENSKIENWSSIDPVEFAKK